MESRPNPRPQVFRPRKLLAALMVGAGLLWVSVLVYLLHFDGVPFKTMFAAIFFVVLFALSGAYYVRTAIFVDSKGVTYRGVVRTRRFSFSDIKNVDVMPGPVTVYAIRAKGAAEVHFTSIFAHHRRLMELLVDRAGLAPVR